jgi:hypothetical protein
VRDLKKCGDRGRVHMNAESKFACSSGHVFKVNTAYIEEQVRIFFGEDSTDD